MIFDLNDFRTVLLIGVFVVMLGTLIACTTKKYCNDVVKIFFGLFVIICGFTLIGFAFCIACTESKVNETKRDILQIVYEQKYNIVEIDYSVMKVDSITNDTIYYQCSKDTFSLQ